MPLRDAIVAYFTGERSEMIAILVGAVAMILASGALWLKLRDGFATGFAITVIAAGLLLGTTAVALLARDTKAAPALLRALAAPESSHAAIIREATRIDAVIRAYPTYRYVGAGLLALALAGLLLAHRDWIQGVAMGLMLVAAAQVLIDHYSEQRARRYAGQLATN